MLKLSSPMTGGRGATRLHRSGLPSAWRVFAISALAWFALAFTQAQAEPHYPAFSAPVVDDANVLSDADKATITRKLLNLQDKTGIQFVVATVASLDGEEIEPYANGLFRQWKIGEKGVNNGLLLLLAPKQRRLRFEVGYGLEGAFTDLQSKLILRNTMVPKLKSGDPAAALQAGVDDAIAVLTKNKDDLPARLRPDQSSANDTGDTVLGLIIFFFVFLVVLSIIVQTFRRGRRSGWGPAAAGSYIGGSDFGSSDSFSGGGDSFSGGGGGDSGGGGSSDSY